MKNQAAIRTWLIGLFAILTLSIGLNAQDAVAPIASISNFPNRSQDLSKLPKMERDIIILQNVLNDLFNGDRGSFYDSRGSKGIYVSGKGVIFNIGFNERWNEVVLLNTFASENESEKKAKKERPATELNAEKQAKLEELSKEFLVNYGSILSELKSGEKVMLNVSYSTLREKEDPEESNGITLSSRSNLVYRGQYRKSVKKRMVTSIDYSAISSYLNGKSSLKEASQKVNQKIVDNTSGSAQDAKIMAGILDDIFQSNFDGNFRRSRKTSWTYFEGFGLMYDLNLTQSHYGSIVAYTVGQNVSTSRVKKTADEKRKENEERIKEVEESYDDLMDLVKESLVTYGRTLRSVKSDEVVILNINFGSSFRKTKLPKAVRLQVMKSQIEAFSRGQKSLDQLKKEIDIKKLSASTSNPHGDVFFGEPSPSYDQMIFETHPEDEHPIVIGGKAKKGNK